MGEDTIYYTLERGMDLMSSHIRSVDDTSELLCFRYMCDKLRVLIAVWLRNVFNVCHGFISLKVFIFCMDSCAAGSDWECIR